MSTARTKRRFFAFLLVVCLAVAGLTGWAAWQARSDALLRGFLAATNVAGVLEQHTARTVEAVDLSLSVAESRLRSEQFPHRHPSRIDQFLRERAAASPFIQRLVVTRPNGEVLYDSTGFPPGSPHFAPQADVEVPRPDGSMLAIGRPTLEPDGGPGTIAFSRRVGPLDAPDAVTVTAIVSLGHFRGFYDDIDLGPNSAIALFTTTGALLVREPHDPDALTRNFGRTELFETRLPCARSGAYEAASPVDGMVRLTSFRRVDGLPFVVVVSVAKTDALAQWYGDLARQASIGLVLFTIILVLGLLVWREMGHRLSAEDRAAAALADLEHKHAVIETILRTLPDGVCLLDPDLRLSGCNDRLFSIFRLDRNAILAAPDPARALIEALAARADPGGASTAETVERITAAIRTPGQYHRRLADDRWIECRHTPLGDKGYLSVYRDVTDEMRRESALRAAHRQAEEQAQQLARTAAELREAQIAAEQANLTKSRFLANMSHELRTPLNAINGFSEIIAGLYLGRGAIEKYREYARDILASGQHLLALINGVLDLSKIEAGKMELWEGTVDLTATVYSALKMVEANADAKGVELNFEPPGRPVLLRADGQKLLQCFLNALSNAVKFTPAGGSVTATITAGPGGPRVVIRDTGVGIAEDDLERVFVPFSQIDSMIARENVGTGLGLPLLRSLIELHGGSVEIASTEGAGTTLVLHLPRSRLITKEAMTRAG